MHFLEGGGHGNHAQGHGHILKLIRELAQLPGRFSKLIQAEALELGGGGYHGFGDDDLPHHGGELIQLAQADADQALAVRLGCRLGLGGLPGGDRGRRLFRGRGLGLRSGGWGRGLIDGLVGAHGAGVRDRVDCGIPLGLIPEIEHKAGVHDLRRRIGVVTHIGGKILEGVPGAAVADCIHKHKCPQVLHAGALVKEDLEGVGEAGNGCRTGICRSLRRSRRSPGRRSGGAILNLLNKTINFLEKTVDSLSERLSVFRCARFPHGKSR